MSPTPTPRSKVQRIPDRGHYDRATIDAILDEALICHVGFVDGGQPFVIPTIPLRVDDHLYLHGSRVSRMLKIVAQGEPVCITVTHLDGLVLARSAFHHSMNYRSVVVLGKGHEITELEEKRRVLHLLTEDVVPGRTRDAREPNDKELNATTVVALPINEASAKVRQGPPGDDPKDMSLPIWAGVVPLRLTAGEPIPDPQLDGSISLPSYLK